MNASLLGLANILTGIVLDQLGVPLVWLIALSVIVWTWWIVRTEPVAKRLWWVPRVRLEIGRPKQSELSPVDLDQPGVPPPATSDPVVEVEEFRALLRDAVGYLRNLPDGPADTIEQAFDPAWVAHVVVSNLLNGALVVSPSHEYNAYLLNERNKLGDRFRVTTAAAMYLERLANRIAATDLDGGFVMPHSFKQFRETENWPHNARP